MTIRAAVDGRGNVYGEGAPLPGPGRIGDIYIDVVANLEYGPKTAAGWGEARSRVGPRGIDGWTRVTRFVPRDGDVVEQIIDWTGGEGTKPAVGVYVGGASATGYVANIADAANVRGPAGSLEGIDDQEDAGEVALVDGVPITQEGAPRRATVGDIAAFGLLAFNSKEHAEENSVSPAVFKAIYLRGRDDADDGGGARYKYVGSEPSHDLKLQTADGSWWEIDEPVVTVLMAGAKGGGVINDTAAFSRSAAARLFVLVPYVAGGYNVDSSVVNASSMFLFEGAFITAQLVGTATRYQLRAASIHASQWSLERMRLEPAPRTLTGSNEGNKRGLFIKQTEPDLSSVDYGDGHWHFNEIDCKWDGERTGTGFEGSSTSSSVHALQVSLNVGGSNFDLASAKAFSAGLTHDTDDICTGDKVGFSSGVSSVASSLGKIYGGASSFSLGSGGVTPQAIGKEVDCLINGTAVVTNALGFNAWSGGTVSAVGTYAAYGIGRSGAVGSVPWKTGFMLYTADGDTLPPIDTTGDLFASDHDATIANVFNFDNVTITGFFFSGKQTKIKDTTTNSTSPETGAITIGGGIGVALDAWVAGSVFSRTRHRVVNSDYVAGSAGAFVQMVLGATSGSTHGIIQALNDGGTTQAELKLNPTTGAVSLGSANSTTSVVGKASFSAGTTARAPINMASGVAPSAPANGDLWFDGTDINVRVGGVTKTITMV